MKKLSTSLLKAAKGSDAAQSMVIDWKRCQIATTVQLKIIVGGVLGLAPRHSRALVAQNEKDSLFNSSN